MRTQSLLTVLILILVLAFTPIHAWAQCYGTPGCERPETFVATYTKWGSSVNFIRWKVSTARDGNRIISDAIIAARQWNDARCNGQRTGFPPLSYNGTTSIQAGRRGYNQNIVGFAHVDGPGRRLAQADIITHRTDNNRIVEAHIRLDYYEDHDAHSEWDRPRPRDQIGHCIRDTLTHEFGHWVQLNDVRHTTRNCPGSGHVCSGYRWYTMNNCVEKDQHFREDLHTADKHAAWYTYNRSNPAPRAIFDAPPPFERGESVLQTRLLNNYPDPFNPETWIPYELAHDANVSIEIYDSMGKHVRLFDLDKQERGRYYTKTKALHWDGRNDSGEHVASGVYFYTLQADGVSDTQQLVILK